MIKKSVFENEIIAGMQRKLAKPEIEQAMDKIVQAADYLNSAVEIFEDAGMTKQADSILRILAKIAQDNQDAKHKSSPKGDPHTKGLTPEKMIENYKHHGIPFNMADDNKSDDLLNLDVDDNNLEVSEKEPHELDFEDEV